MKDADAEMADAELDFGAAFDQHERGEDVQMQDASGHGHGYGYGQLEGGAAPTDDVALTRCVPDPSQDYALNCMPFGALDDG